MHCIAVIDDISLLNQSVSVYQVNYIFSRRFVPKYYVFVGMFITKLEPTWDIVSKMNLPHFISKPAFACFPRFFRADRHWDLHASTIECLYILIIFDRPLKLTSGGQIEWKRCRKIRLKNVNSNFFLFPEFETYFHNYCFAISFAVSPCSSSLSFDYLLRFFIISIESPVSFFLFSYPSLFDSVTISI